MRYGFIDPPRERRAILRAGVLAALLVAGSAFVSTAIAAHVLLDVYAHSAPVCPAGVIR